MAIRHSEFEVPQGGEPREFRVTVLPPAGKADMIRSEAEIEKRWSYRRSGHGYGRFSFRKKVGQLEREIAEEIDMNKIKITVDPDKSRIG